MYTFVPNYIFAYFWLNYKKKYVDMAKQQKIIEKSCDLMNNFKIDG